ncbi:cytochrome c [Marinobacter lipolyticus]|uniref:SorU family sulfite dehydrogenase c-type cytochrome subunit n=1 Tax=Marinobacter lipolyticus TaxID=209639 RepID=UPI001BD14CC5|nr:cytochrome c [Marinobacter lipolyticus]MBS8240237.1 cytochrome c [Marinobacter lipolyticus]
MKTTALLASTLLAIAVPVASADEGRMAQGKKVFSETAQPSCTICHTLNDAGSSGAIGPDLDELKPSQKQVREAVRSGVGVMPAFGESLSEDDIDAVAFYVASITGGATE